MRLLERKTGNLLLTVPRRFPFVFDLLLNLFGLALWPSVGKELYPWLFACAVFAFGAVLIVGVPPCPFGVRAFEPRQANLCLRSFRHDKFQLRMSSHSEGPGIWLSV